MINRILGIVTFAFLALSSCGGSEEYLFYFEKPKADVHEEHYKVRELVGNSQVDILWVVDNSGSMSSYQQQVIKNTDVFIQEFTKNPWLRWKMGVVSTDVEGRPIMGFEQGDEFLHNDAHPVQRFQDAIARLGTAGSGTEQPIAVTKMQLERYQDFLRKDAMLVMVMMTDAYDQSEEGSHVTVGDFVSFLKTLKPSLAMIKSYGIFAAKDYGCTVFDADPWDYAGSAYESFMSLTSGVVFHFARMTLERVFQLGKDIVRAVSYPKLLLGERPKAESIEIYYEDEKVPGGLPENGGLWTYDFFNNAIVFYSLDFANQDDLGKVKVVYSKDDGF